MNFSLLLCIFGLHKTVFYQSRDLDSVYGYFDNYGEQCVRCRFIEIIKSVPFRKQVF